MAHYLVTGGAGFIGSHLVDRLLQLKHRVTVLDNLTTGKRENISPGAEFVMGDVCDPVLVFKLLSHVDGCFHLAALLGVTCSQQDWLGTHQVNCGGTITLFAEAARQRRENHRLIPIVYASSCAVYGDIKELPLSESMLPMPLSAYAADKLACELHGKVATYIDGIPTVGLRFFNVYGLRQDPKSPYSGVISVFVHHMKHDQPITIFGDGEQTRDFIYVSDVIEHLIFFMKHKTSVPAVINVCTGKTVSINELIRALELLFDKQANTQYLPVREGDARYSCGDPSLAKSLGIAAHVSLSDGLAKLTH